MLTDGYIGNEAQIIEHVGKNCGDQIRFWAIGMGSSPNMFLIDGVARQGGGMGKRLGLQDDSESLSHEVMTRIQRAQLADVKIDWGDLQIAETYPARIPELWAGRPVILFGRYTEGGSQRITVSGRVEGEDMSWPLEVNLRGEKAEHKALAKVWARKKIEDLMQQTFYAGSPAIEEEVTAIALDYRLMSQYTSFVAVDADKLDEMSDPARPPRRMAVPVPLPEGTSWEGFFGESADEELDFVAGVRFSRSAKPASPLSARGSVRRLALSQAPPSPASPRAVAGFQSLQASESLPRLSVQLGRGGGLQMWGAAPVRGKTLSRGGRAYGNRGIGGGGFGGGGFGRGDFGFAGQASRQYFQAESLVESEAAFGTNVWRYLPRLSAERAKPVGEAAAKALDAAKQFEKDGKLAKAREALMRAYLLDAAVLNGVQAGGQVAAEAVQTLERVHAQQVKGWTAKNSALGKKLDLVIRDKSLAESLEMVRVASGIEIELLAGSTADSALMTRDDVRVDYLDLRRATVAQALDWILHPQRMSWQSKGDVVIAGTDRRQPGPSAWVYDVSLLLPSAKELEEAGDDSTKVAAETLVTSLRAHLSADDLLSIVWFGPGHLLVVGDVDRHASVDKWMGEQRRATPAVLAAQRKAAAETSSSTHHRHSIASVHASAAWQLLAAAAEGELDLEVLTELQIAWRSKRTSELLDGKSAAVVLRSLWCVAEAARALPDEAELNSLAIAARAKSRTAATVALEALGENRDDASAFAGVLYAALAMRDDQQLVGKAVRLLTDSQPSDSPLAPARTVARILLASPKAADVEEILKMTESGVAGQDMTTMLAIACRRAGGEAWSTFRRHATDLLGNQPLAGSVLVLINRLNASQLELAATVQ